MLDRLDTRQTVVNSVFQMEAYAAKLKELETLFSDMDGGFQPANREMDASLRAAQDAVEDMQSSIKRLAGKTTCQSSSETFSIVFY